MLVPVKTSGERDLVRQPLKRNESVMNSSEGWEALIASAKESILRIFLSVLVAEANLAV